VGQDWWIDAHAAEARRVRKQIALLDQTVATAKAAKAKRQTVSPDSVLAALAPPRRALLRYAQLLEGDMPTRSDVPDP